MILKDNIRILQYQFNNIYTERERERDRRTDRDREGEG